MEEVQSEPVTRPVKQRSAGVNFLLETIQTVILALILYFVIDTVVARVRVENISMKPTLDPGEFILVNKFAYRLGTFQRGDIIIFHYPPHPEEDFIKRVIGLPGEEISVKEGRVWVNNQPLDEPYIAANPDYSGTWRVAPGTIFVLGDNRNQSSDSHAWGFVPLANVIGKALVVYWPPGQLKFLSRQPVVSAAN